MAFFPSLRLPAEVRTRIYRLVLNDGKPIRVYKQARQPFLPSTTRSGKSLRPKIDDEDRERASGHPVLAITATCRQIYLEAISQYYAGNAFECCTTWCLFLDSIGMTNKNLISEIRIYAQGCDDLNVLEHLACLRSLKVILGLRCPDCTGAHTHGRRVDWFDGTHEALWNFCVGRPTMEKISMIRTGSWAGAGTYPHLEEIDREIRALNKYLNLTKGNSRIKGCQTRAL